MREENTCEADSQTPVPRLPAGTRHTRARARVSSVVSRAGGRADNVLVWQTNRPRRRRLTAGRLSAAPMPPRELVLDPLESACSTHAARLLAAVGPAVWFRRRRRHHGSLSSPIAIERCRRLVGRVVPQVVRRAKPADRLAGGCLVAAPAARAIASACREEYCRQSASGRGERQPLEVLADDQQVEVRVNLCAGGVRGDHRNLISRRGFHVSRDAA